MTVYLFSVSYDIGQIICDHLTSNNYTCFLFKDLEELSKTMNNLKELPDLLVLDYTIFNHDFFNIFGYLMDGDVDLPVIFFNDPCIVASTRTRHWLFNLDMINSAVSYIKYTDEIKEEYEKLFTLIEEVVELDSLAPYISLMQKTKKLPKYFTREKITLDFIKKNSEDCIKSFKKNVNLSNRLYYLLKIFFDNRDSTLTLKDIQNLYTEDGKQMSENSLKTLISRLRTEMRKDKNFNFLIRNNKGVYSLVEIK